MMRKIKNDNTVSDVGVVKFFDPGTIEFADDLTYQVTILLFYSFIHS